MTAHTHEWEINVETIGMDVYSAQQQEDGTFEIVFEGADADSTESQGIFRIFCRACGHEADADEQRAIEDAMVG